MMPSMSTVPSTRCLRPPANHLGKGPADPDPVVVLLAARTVLLRMAATKQAEALLR